jgi:hypothetical protein
MNPEDTRPFHKPEDELRSVYDYKHGIYHVAGEHLTEDTKKLIARQVIESIKKAKNEI